jgi:hypothetical protein
MPDETRSLTYLQIAQLRRISLDSAKRLVLRRGWERTPGNDGLTRILVPLDALPVGDDIRPDVRPDVGDDVPGDVSPILNGNSSKAASLLNEYDDPTVSPTNSDYDGLTVGPIVSLISVMTSALHTLETSLGSLHEQLSAANQRAENAEHRANASDQHIKELRAALATKDIEHRQIEAQLLTEIAEQRELTAALVAQLTRRHRWWPWRRSS